jgi:hypothetical protein
VRRYKDDEDDLFGGLTHAAPAADPPGGEDEGEDEDHFPDSSPSRANVVAALAIADDETDLKTATYYVQRAIAESLLLAIDLLAERGNPSSP